MKYALIEPSEVERVVAGYIAHLCAGKSEKDGYSWAWDRVYDFLCDEPENAWLVLVQLALRPDNAPEEIAYIAAGPTEMLLAKHGADFIDRYIEVARWEPQFCDLLGGVWKSTIPDEIWNGIAAISGPAW